MVVLPETLSLSLELLVRLLELLLFVFEPALDDLGSREKALLERFKSLGFDLDSCFLLEHALGKAQFLKDGLEEVLFFVLGLLAFFLLLALLHLVSGLRID